MRKKFLSIMLILTMAFGMCGAVCAAEEEDAASEGKLESYGKIIYRDGSDTVVIDSQDFYKLSKRIDLVKRDIAKQLKGMHTYFTTGEGVSVKTDENIRVAHTEPSGDHIVDPLSINFNTILEGVAASQSVPSDAAAYGYAPGTVLYKNGDGVLTSDSSEKGAEQIDITAATADNLSVGTAAWVDGSLILGTGEDNKSYREKGYKNGQEKGYKEGYNEGYKNGQSNVKCQYVRIGTGSKTVRFTGGSTHGYIVRTDTMREGGGPTFNASGNVKFTQTMSSIRNDSRDDSYKSGCLAITSYSEFTITDANEVAFTFTNTKYPDDPTTSMTALIVLDR